MTKLNAIDRLAYMNNMAILDDRHKSKDENKLIFRLFNY